MFTGYNISLAYDTTNKVLDQVSFKIPKGAFYFLTGASGAGKSTLLNIISLSLRPTSGVLNLFGQDVGDLAHDDLPALRQQIGIVYQDFKLLDHLNVFDNIALPLKIRGESDAEIQVRVHQMLQWINMEHYGNARPDALSGGEKQRVAIARAVINNPPLLIADEPSGNLDPKLSRKFMFLFQKLHNMGTTIIYATHDMSLIEQFNYPVMHLENGGITIRHHDAAKKQ